MSTIVVEGLTRCYGRRRAVDDLSFEVEQGTLWGFLGPNGAGKTTTIRILLGFLRPHAGRALVLDRDCWSESRRIKADVGYLPGDVRLYSYWNARLAGRILSHAHGRDLSEEVTRLCETFDLNPDVRVRRMSRGMRQKLGLILALAHRPKVLVLDEPTASLDPIIQAELYRQLRALADGGHTIFFSSHTLSEVERLCDRVAILRRGKLVAQERLADLRVRAKRSVTITWKESVDLSRLKEPAFLRILSVDGRSWRATLEGRAGDLIAWCKPELLDDLALGEPDLETLFHQFYQTEPNHE